MKKAPSMYATFRSDILWMMEPFVEYAQDQADDRFINGNVFIEPADDGGAYIGAVCNHAMLVVHDQCATCNEAATLSIPYSILRAAAPADPVHMTYCGECFFVAPPEWMAPGLCSASTSGMFIQPKMRPPCFAEEDPDIWPALTAVIASTTTHRVGVDYRATRGVPVNWRKPLKNAATKAKPEAPSAFYASPEIFSLFDRAFKTAIDDAIAREQGPPAMHFSLTDPAGEIIVTIEDRPDIIGCMMPMKGKENSAPSVPWHFLKSPRASASVTNGCVE